MVSKPYEVKNGFLVGNTVSNSSGVFVGGNLSLSFTDLKIGNSTINALSNSIMSMITNSTGNTRVTATQFRVANSTVSSNLDIGLLSIGTSTLNSTALAVSTVNAGANVSLSTTNLLMGNSTVNVIVNSSLLLVGSNVMANQTHLMVGYNSTTNLVANSVSIKISNSTTNTFISLPNTVQYSSTNYFLHANGSWTVLPPSTLPGGSNTHVQYNNSGDLGGSAAFTFDITGNTLLVSNSINSLLMRANTSMTVGTTGANVLITPTNIGGLANAQFNIANVTTGNIPTLISGTITSNSTGVWGTGSINALSFSIGATFIANTSGVYSVGIVNASSVNALSHTVGASFTANSTLVNAAAINVTGRVNVATFYATTTVNVGSQQINTTGFVGNGFNLTSTKWNGASYTVSTSAPSGGSDGDFWFERVA